MVAIELFDRVQDYLIEPEKALQVCCSKQGSNEKVKYIYTFTIPNRASEIMKVSVLGLKTREIYHFDVEAHPYLEVLNISHLSFLDLPEEEEELIYGALRSMVIKIEGEKKRKAKHLAQMELPKELRKSQFSTKHWNGFFVHNVSKFEDKEIDNELAIAEGFATREMVDHLRSLGLAFKKYVRQDLQQSI